MANDLNSCSFIGRLGKDVEVRFTPKGDAVANFSIACGYEYRDKNATKVEHTEWVNVAVYGKLAELCGQYLTKGSQVYVGGRLKTDKYTKDGQERFITRLQADKVQFLGSKQSSNGAGSEPTNQGAGQPPLSEPQNFYEMPDDIPF